VKYPKYVGDRWTGSTESGFFSYKRHSASSQVSTNLSFLGLCEYQSLFLFGFLDLW
jgi:hypothetical protein